MLSLVCSDAAGTELLRTEFGVSFEVSSIGGNWTSAVAPFHVAMACPDGLHTVQIVRQDTGRGDVVLASRSLLPTTPTVELLSPNGGGTLTGEHEVTWTATDATEYDLHLSQDGGETFSCVVAGVTETSAILDFSRYDESDQNLLKVTAYDGFSQAEDVSDATFTTANRPSDAHIWEPLDGTILVADEHIVFRSTVADPEDGALPREDIMWVSDIDGELGHGEAVAALLSIGTHVVTLTATDSVGASTSATVSVVVGDRNELPIADAGDDRYVDGGDTVVLDGSSSFDPNGDDLVFSWQIADGPEGTAFDDPSSPTPSFVAPVSDVRTTISVELTVADPDGNTRSDTVTVTVTPQVYTRDVELAAGWNLVSLPVQPSGATKESILASIEGSYSSVWGYENGLWQFFDPADPGSSDLETITSVSGYWIKMSEAATLSLSGYAPATGRRLSKGWNLVGVPSSEPLPVEEAIAGIKGFCASVWAYENGLWTFYDPAKPVGSDLLEMKPGVGYWVKTTEDCIWQMSGTDK